MAKGIKWTAADIERVKQTKLRDSAKISKKKPVVSANTLTKHALRVLDLKGFHVWRQNNGGVYDPTKKIFRANSSTPGISDIIGFHRKTGQIVACEIKAGKDRLSPAQERFLKSVANAGGISLVVKTIDDLENFMKLKLRGESMAVQRLRLAAVWGLAALSLDLDTVSVIGEVRF